MEGNIALNTNMIMVLAILGVTIILFAFEILRVDVTAISIMVLLGLSGLVPSDQLFNGFASNAVISIIAVMILGAGLDRTGVMGSIAAWLLRVGGNTERRLQLLINTTMGAFGGFMQNTGVAALFLPVVSRVASRANVPLSRLLMPMGFCAILSGTITMVGSSPLILLNDLLATSNRNLPQGVDTIHSFSLFSVTPVGLMLLAAGVVYFLLLGRKVLPKIDTPSATPGGTRDYFAEVYGIRGDIYEVTVGVDSPLVGLTVGEAEASVESPLILALRSGDEPILAPPADEMIWTGSILAVMGPREQVDAYAEANELRVQPRLRNFGRLVNPARAGISEVVISPGSKLVGKTIGDVRMRKRYGLNVLAINRGDEILRDDIRDTRLRVGDSLVIHSTWRDLAAVAKDRDFVVVTDIPKTEQRPHKVWHALVFFAIAIGLVVFTDFRVSIALLTGALGMILTGVLSIDEAYQAVSWKTVFLLASLIPLGYAMETTGTAAWIAQGILHMLGDVSALTLQFVVAFLATFFTLVMSNVGATVLLVPLAINLAIEVGGDPAVFAITVALATSNAFILPTHQVNALIMGPGGYRVMDFMRAGSLLTLIYIAVLIPMVNLVF